MNKKNTEKKAMSAVQFSRKMSGIMNFMEGIASKTRETQDALLENIDPGVFDMSTMLDVNVQDDDTQPLLTMRKPKELNDGDKAQIVEELAEVLKRMPGEVIDFSDIGPIATVIQTKLGFNQSLDGFINDLISGAADKQDSQSFAKGTSVPGVQDSQSAGALGQDTDKAPTDITPPKATITDAPSEATIPAVDPMMGNVDPMMGGDTLPTDDLSTQVGNELGDISFDAPGDVSIDAPIENTPDLDIDLDTPAPDIDAPAPESDIDAPAPDVDDIDMEDDDIDLEFSDIDDKGEGEDKGEDKDDTKEDEDETKKLEAQLEAVRDNFFLKTRTQKINNLVESIKSKDPILESISTKFHAKVNEENRNKAIKARLESIVSNAKAEQKVQNILEGIAKKAKEESKKASFVKKNAPVAAPAVSKIKKTVKPSAKLESDVKPELDALIESYRSSKSAKLESINARTKAREAIENLMK